MPHAASGQTHQQPQQFSQAAEDGGDLMHLGWHFDYEEEFHGSTLTGTRVVWSQSQVCGREQCDSQPGGAHWGAGHMPLLDLKASWFVSDHTDPRHGTTCLVPGSFRWDAHQRATWQQWLDPALICQVSTTSVHQQHGRRRSATPLGLTVCACCILATRCASRPAVCCCGGRRRCTPY